MTRVRLLGRPRHEGGRQPRGQKSWALLARVALSDRPVARRELAFDLFQDADDPLGALRWSLADVRRSLAVPDALRGDRLRLNPDEIWLDVWALEDGTLDPDDIGGVLLDGVDLRNCPSFDTWLVLARARWRARSMEELRERALDRLTSDDPEGAATIAGRAAQLDPLDEAAQELFLRTLVAAGHEAQATVHLASSTATFAREGLPVSAALRQAARGTGTRPRTGLRAGVVAGSLLSAGTAALTAGAVDAGVETLRRAAEEVAGAGDDGLEAEILLALGGALIHAVRGFDGEGAVVLHRALGAARAAQRPEIVAEIHRQLAFVDVQAGRHASAARALLEARRQAAGVDDAALSARILALHGMNEADRGRHTAAITVLGESAALARQAGAIRQQAWSHGLEARSLLLSGHPEQARRAAEASMVLAREQRWNAFLPWPQVMRAQALAERGEWDAAHADAEQAFALACELGDPCWEGMAGRAIGVLAAQSGDEAGAREWLDDAQRRCDRVSDRYVWVSAYIALAAIECTLRDPAARLAAARRLYHAAVRADLPEFIAWSLVHQAEAGDAGRVPLARSAAAGVSSPALQTRVRALIGPG